MKTPFEIISNAIDTYRPKAVTLLFSGGHDSLVSTHISANILQTLDVPFTVYHGDTTIGIPETQDFVKSVCENFKWNLVVRQPPNEEDRYEAIVKRFGFPGPTKQSHQIMYRRLKERALNNYVTHELKSSSHSRENVLLISGIRKSESRIRMGYLHETQKVDSKVWSCPIFWFSENDCKKYMIEHDLPRNPVKDKICISGECLCGAFAGKEEWAEIQNAYPEVAKRIKKLHADASENGFPWPWSMGPTEWYKIHPPGQMDMFMCVGCENKHDYASSTITK